MKMLTEQENIEITARRRLERFREVEMMGLAGHFEVRWVPARREEEASFEHS